MYLICRFSLHFNEWKWCCHMNYDLNITVRMEFTLHWRHNDYDDVSNHQPHGCLLNRLFRRRSNKTSKLRVTGLCVGNSPGPVTSPHKGPVTRKMFPFDDVIMNSYRNNIVTLIITIVTLWYISGYDTQLKMKSLYMHGKNDIDICIRIWTSISVVYIVTLGEFLLRLSYVSGIYDTGNEHCGISNFVVTVGKWNCLNDKLPMPPVTSDLS